jgi:flagellar hook-basal body complex protein FliE
VSLAIDNSLTLANSGGIERADRMDRMDRALDNSGVGEATEFGKAIGEIDKLQTAADTQADAVARGAGNIHEMALAMDKADVAMRLAMRVRNKLVDTYNDIMKMGI